MTGLGLMGLAGVLAMRDGHHPEHQGEHGEDERLDHPHEHLQPVEGQRQQQRRQKGEHEDDHLSGKHVAEETEGEADDAHQLRHQLQKAHEGVYDPLEQQRRLQGQEAPPQPPEVEELAGVEPHPQAADAPVFDGDGGRQGQGQGHVDVGVHAAQEGQELAHQLPFLLGVAHLFLRTRLAQLDGLPLPLAQSREGD